MWQAYQAGRLGHLVCVTLVFKSFIVKLIVHTLEVTEVAAVKALPTMLHDRTVAFGALISVCTSRAGSVEKSLFMPLHFHRSPMALLLHKTRLLWLAGQGYIPFRSHSDSPHHATWQWRCICHPSLVHPSLVHPQPVMSDAALPLFLDQEGPAAHLTCLICTFLYLDAAPFLSASRPVWSKVATTPCIYSMYRCKFGQLPNFGMVTCLEPCRGHYT